jgi:hypothetical protein
MAIRNTKRSTKQFLGLFKRRKKSAPPPESQYNFSDGLGMSFNARISNGVFSNHLQWDALDQDTIGSARQAKRSYTQWLEQIANNSEEGINQQAETLYTLAKSDLSASLNREASRIRSNLTQRLKGTQTSTFGALTLASLAEKEGQEQGLLRLRSREQAWKEASTLNRLQLERLDAINGILEDYSSRAEWAANQGRQALYGVEELKNQRYRADQQYKAALVRAEASQYQSDAQMIAALAKVAGGGR